jgi:hypothetical protein
MSNLPFFNGPFNIKHDNPKPIHFEPPKEETNLKSHSFNNGPFKIKYENCKPIHFEPPKEETKEIKIKIPWNQASVKSNKLFKYESLQLRII